MPRGPGARRRSPARAPRLAPGPLAPQAQGRDRDRDTQAEGNTEHSALHRDPLAGRLEEGNQGMLVDSPVVGSWLVDTPVVADLGVAALGVLEPAYATGVHAQEAPAPGQQVEGSWRVVDTHTGGSSRSRGPLVAGLLPAQAADAAARSTPVGFGLGALQQEPAELLADMRIEVDTQQVVDTQQEAARMGSLGEDMTSPVFLMQRFRRSPPSRKPKWLGHAEVCAFMPFDSTCHQDLPKHLRPCFEEPKTSGYKSVSLSNNQGTLKKCTPITQQNRTGLLWCGRAWHRCALAGLIALDQNLSSKNPVSAPHADLQTQTRMEAN